MRRIWKKEKRRHKGDRVGSGKVCRRCMMDMLPRDAGVISIL